MRAMSPRFNAETFEAFLKKLLRHRARDRKMVVILDNARYHHARLLSPLLHRYRRQLSLLFLPPYCPQLVPIERVWKLAPPPGHPQPLLRQPRRAAHGHRSVFDDWRKPNSSTTLFMRHYLRRYV